MWWESMFSRRRFSLWETRFDSFYHLKGFDDFLVSVPAGLVIAQCRSSPLQSVCKSVCPSECPGHIRAYMPCSKPVTRDLCIAD
jgi:hypothetical protein